MALRPKLSFIRDERSPNSISVSLGNPFFDQRVVFQDIRVWHYLGDRDDMNKLGKMGW